MTDNSQPRLIPDAESDDDAIEITSETVLEDAVKIYLEHLQATGASKYTVKAFKSDLNVLADYFGDDITLGEFDRTQLNKWLDWMLNERGIPCSPKTYARRVTTLKNFFGYLTDIHVLERNPSAGVIQRTVTTPLPDILVDTDLEAVLAVTRKMRHDPDKADTRPLFLVKLVTLTSLKKGEVMALRYEDFDRSNPERPFVYVRYNNPKMRYKERKIIINDELLELLDEYMAQRQPENVVFDCTARNLEYVLRDVAILAAVPRKMVGFEGLRWTGALNDFRAGIDEDKLRQKLGLSRVSWRETIKKLRALREKYYSHEVRAAEDAAESQ